VLFRSAYEMARQLETEGEKVALLALLDSAPANAGYELMRWWRPAFSYRFIRNLYYWFEDFWRLEPKVRLSFILRKTRAFARKLVRRFQGKSGGALADLEEVIDPTLFPEHEQKLWQIHLRALTEHVEQPYHGPVTLFRTRGQPLFCSLEEDFCWGHLARGNVAIRLVSGSHEGVFVEPNVKALANMLAQALNEAQSTAAPASPGSYRAPGGWQPRGEAFTPI